MDTTVTALTTKHTSNPLPRLKIKNDSPSSSPPSSSSTSSLSSSSDEDATTISPLLWVPADQHPEIAPGEFTKWLETNGSNNLARRKSSLRRKSSVLSQTHVPTSEEETDDDTMGQQQQQPTSIVKSTSLMAIPESTSGQKAPRGNRSLLRRSAFSARGRGRKLTTSTRRHGNTTSLDEPTTPTSHQQEDQASPETVNTSEPIRLYDRPVSMNEWVDLGSASLSGYSGGNSQQDILSRVHDAESHILSQLSDDTDTATTTNLTTGIDDLKPMTEDQPIETLPPPPLSDNNNNNSNYFNQDQQDHLIPSSQPDQTTPLPTRKTMADPRRPLRHQVAISNLMFWYLSIIHHDSPTLLSTYAQQQQQQQQQPTNTILAASSNTPSTTLHAHFDDSLPRVSYPIATPQEQSDDDDDDDDGDDDDLPLSYYKQA
ncbi:hypothetical protein BC941DRAFT_456566 [Chlamydoabsidia padenii]|nr:hypothetical protein BC941DRAFT_456566 [Chlamydoabsidia padenii]